MKENRCLAVFVLEMLSMDRFENEKFAARLVYSKLLDAGYSPTSSQGQGSRSHEENSRFHEEILAF